MSQEICSSPNTLPTPQLFLDRLSASQGDTAVLSCLVPLDAPMTCIVFCKEGKEISVQPKGGNELVYDLPHPVSRESSWAFSCHYQLMDENQENNSLPNGDGSGGDTSPQGPAIPLWVWILSSTLVLLLLVSTPIITCILRKRAITQPIRKALGGMSGRKRALAASQEICSSSGDLPALTLILDKGSARHGDTITLLFFVPMDTSVTCVIFCKGGKEISMLPKDRNKFIFESAQLASPESAGEYFCHYQHKDDKNQEKNSLPSARRHVSAPDGPSPSGSDSSGGEPSPPVPSCCDSFPGLGLIVGLAITAGLALGLLGCFLMKTELCRAAGLTG
ncbi:unnamed protein product [Eretmochelys imbricata]